MHEVPTLAACLPTHFMEDGGVRLLHPDILREDDKSELVRKSTSLWIPVTVGQKPQTKSGAQNVKRRDHVRIEFDILEPMSQVQCVQVSREGIVGAADQSHGASKCLKANFFQIGRLALKISGNGIANSNHLLNAQRDRCGGWDTTPKLGQRDRERMTHDLLEIPESCVAVKRDCRDLVCQSSRLPRIVAPFFRDRRL